MARNGLQGVASTVSQLRSWVEQQGSSTAHFHPSLTIHLIPHGFQISYARATALLCTVAAVLLLSALFSWRPRRKAGGPPTYPLIKNMLGYIENADRMLDWVWDTLRESGSSWCRLEMPGVSEIYVTDPRDVEHMLKTNFANYPKGLDASRIQYDLLGAGIFNNDGGSWREQRKAASHALSIGALRDTMFQTFLRKIEEGLVPIVDDKAARAAEFDIQELFLRYTFDSFCSIAFGVEPNSLQSPSPHMLRFLEALDGGQELLSERFNVPHIVFKVKKAFGIGSEKKLAEAVKEIDHFLDDVIRQRRANLAQGKDPQRQDLLSCLMGVADGERHKASGAPNDGVSEAAPDKYLRHMMLNFLLAGRDTVPPTLAWLLWVLTQHRDIEAKILAEVEKIASTKEAGAPFTFEDVRGMSYLQAALSETLRLYPPVPLVEVTAVKDDVLPSGAVVPRGGTLIYHAYSQGHDPELWGPDVDEFKPERWFNADGRYVQPSVYKFTAFQGGPRACMGREIAYIQMKIVAASLLRRFKFSMVPNQVVTYKYVLSSRLKYGLKLVAERR